jgi:hypothetical protein
LKRKPSGQRFMDRASRVLDPVGFEFKFLLCFQRSGFRQLSLCAAFAERPPIRLRSRTSFKGGLQSSNPNRKVWFTLPLGVDFLGLRRHPGS